MPYQLESRLVVGVSARALFDMTRENEIFEKQGLEAYCRYQAEHEQDILKPGPGFGLIKALLKLNEGSGGKNPVEVIVMSHNSPETSLRVFHAISGYGLPITRAVLASGASPARYLAAFHTDLFLSPCEEDVQYAIDNGIAAGVICTECSCAAPRAEEIRIAFDGDAVLFGADSEMLFKERGLSAFEENEKRYAREPLPEGPFAGLLKKLTRLQREFGEDSCPIRTALVTSRSAPAHERVIRTLKAWDVQVDEAFFLGGVDKREVLKAFDAQIFFDDQAVHTASVSREIPAARVPYGSREKESFSNEI